MATPTDPLERLRSALRGQYQVERLLGQGGMGTVYLALDLTLDRQVAIKVVSHEVASGDELRERFLREARVVAKLRHPNIVAVYSAGEVNGQLYFVMELVPGESLRDMIERDGPLEPGKVHRLVGELAMALDYAHQHGVVHRDVKPENILIDRETGRAMLTDFGVARALEQEGTLTGIGILLGSPRYMSPEQATGEPTIDGRSDLYALSLVGYEMLTGRAVVDAPSAAAMLVKHLNETPRPIAEVVPNVPPDLARAVSVGLEKNRDQRWPSGRAMAEALGTAVSPADPAGSVTRRTVISRRTRLVAMLVAGVAVAAAGLWWRGRDELSRQAYVIVPFEVQSGNSDIRWLREGAVNMLTLSLSQWQDLTVTDYERTLDLVQGAGVAEGARVPLDAARNVARRAGAGSLVMGQISTTADSLIVVAALYDASSGKQVNRVSRAAAIGADPRPVFDQVGRYLLDVAGGTGTTTIDLAKATTTSLGAYRDYLDGLRALNQWRLTEADSLFARATARDSTFALAFHKRAQTRGWSDAGGLEGIRNAQQAEALAGRLPPRERALVRAYLQLTTGLSRIGSGDTTGARHLLLAEQLYDSLTRDSTAVAEAWYGLGDARFHQRQRVPLADRPHLMTGAMRAFRKTLEVDPEFHLAYSHLADLYTGFGTGDPLVLHGDSVVPAASITPAAAQRALRDSARLLAVSISRDWVRADPEAAEAYFQLLQTFNGDMPDSAVLVVREGIRRTGRESANLRLALPFFVYFARQPASMRATLDSALSQVQPADVRRRPAGERLFWVSGAVSTAAATGDSRLLVRAADLMVHSDSLDPSSNQRMRPVLDAAVTAFRVAMGEPVTAGVQQALFGAIRSLDRQEHSFQVRQVAGQFAYLAFLATRDTIMADMAQRILGGTMNELDAARALSTGDTAKALEIAATFISPDSTRKLTLAMGGMRTIARADLMERLGNDAAAIGYHEALDPDRFNLNGIFSPGLTLYIRSFFALGRLYEQRNEPAKARAAYENYLMWWAVDDPITAPERAAAKAALARLRDRASR